MKLGFALSVSQTFAVFATASLTMDLKILKNQWKCMHFF